MMRMVKKEAKEEIIEKLTKYERARLVGSRALQISMGAPFMVEFTKKELESMNYNPVEIAKAELDAGKVPIDVVRQVTKAKARS